MNRSIIRKLQCMGVCVLCSVALVALTQRSCVAQAVVSSNTNPLQQDLSGAHHFEIGPIFQGGVGLTEERGGFKFVMAGVHAGKVLTPNLGHGWLRGNFEYAVEAFPFWQSSTPKFERRFCTNSPGTTPQCTVPYTVGGTFNGASITPIILRWNVVGTKRFSFWGQAAGGLLWTNHKYPAFGGPPYNLQNDGPNADASVWNFTPQGGVGVHYFVRPRRSVDFSANGVHISSASLGDRNPGVNASVQFSVGYTWWK
ncbi:MAG: acyloxyacyl hydrolase [Acidobacteriota bacterium]|nr:acyloxyacyl hydrolase [Acidobacteriota bacterium]